MSDLVLLVLAILLVFSNCWWFIKSVDKDLYVLELLINNTQLLRENSDLAGEVFWLQYDLDTLQYFVKRYCA